MLLNTTYTAHNMLPSMIPPSASNLNSTSQTLPNSATLICPLAFSEINKAKLSDLKIVLGKYAWKMKGTSKAGGLCVKLARETFTSQDILQQSTVRGCRDLPALPMEELRSLITILLTVPSILEKQMRI